MIGGLSHKVGSGAYRRGGRPMFMTKGSKARRCSASKLSTTLERNGSTTGGETGKGSCRLHGRTFQKARMVGSPSLYRPPKLAFRRRSSMSIGVFTPPIKTCSSCWLNFLRGEVDV